MPKPLRKTKIVKAYLNEQQGRQFEDLYTLSGKSSVSEFIVDTVLSTSSSKAKADIGNDILIVLEKHFSDVRSFQAQQQITMYIIMQFVMWLTSEGKSREEIMEFYDAQYKKAAERFENGEE